MYKSFSILKLIFKLITISLVLLCPIKMSLAYEVSIADNILQSYLTLKTNEYKIGEGDLIKIFVYENEEYFETYKVGPDGKISLPFIGTIYVKGLTRDELSNKITQLLSKYITNPIVNVIVLEYKNNYVYLLGDITNPGRYNFEDELSFLLILNHVKLNFQSENQQVKCYIIRNNNIVMEINSLNYNKIFQNPLLANLKLMTNDVLYFETSPKNKIFLLGNISNPGILYFDKNEEVLNTIYERLKDNKDIKIKILRNVDNKLLELNYNISKNLKNNNIQFKTNDIVYILEKNEQFSYCFKRLSSYLTIGILGTKIIQKLKE